MHVDSFLSEFLLLSDFRTLIFIGLLFVLFAFIRYTEKKKVKFSKRMIMGTLLGLMLGLIIQFAAGLPATPEDIIWLKETTSWYGLVGNGFMDLLKMLVIPLVFLSIVRVIMNMKGNNLGKMTIRAIGMLVSTTLIGAVLGIFVSNLFQLGSQMKTPIAPGEIREVTTLIQTIRDLLPANPVASMSNNNIIAVVIFAAFIGVAIRRLNQKQSEVIEPFTKWIEAFYKIILSVAMTIIKFMPYAITALLANTIASRGINALLSVGQFIIAIYVALFLMFIAHLVIAMLNGISPKAYITKGSQPLILAFTSRSSLGTLPVLIETLDQNFKIDEGIASFVGSLGSNMGMNGCAGIYPAMMAVMLARMTDTPLNLSFYILLAIIIAISSFGIVGIPGSATIAISVVISGVGLGAYFPLLGGIIAIDPIIDMGRTLINVSGTMVSALTVAKSLEKDSSQN